jgi:hypothetical protein
MRKSIVSAVAVLFIAANVVYAEDENEKKLGVSFDLTYTTKWLSKGIEAYGSKGGLFKTIDVDFWQSGWGLRITHRNAIPENGYVDARRFDFRPYFKGSILEDTSFYTVFDLSVEFEYYTGLSPNKANTTYEWINSFSWPKLLPWGFVPTYILHYEYPAFSHKANRKNAGGVNRFILGHDINVPDLPNPLKATWEIAHYDGLANRGSEWAYYTFGLSGRVDINKNLAFVPGIYHQTTMDKSISRHKDITYAMFSMKYKF